MSLTQLDYEIIIGESWERLVIIKDYRTHRIRRISTAAAIMKDANGVEVPLTAEVSFEGGITLSLTNTETYTIDPGEYTFDIVADPYGESRTVAQGTVTVKELSRITPLDYTPPEYYGGAYNA